jgi:hypothetical protein
MIFYLLTPVALLCLCLKWFTDVNAISFSKFNYTEALKRLCTTNSIEERHIVAVELLDKCGPLPELKQLCYTEKSMWTTDTISERLLKLRNPQILDVYAPVTTVADSNCLFRAVSLLCYGSDEYHELLRLLCACEVITNTSMYDSSSSQMYEPVKHCEYLVIPPFSEVLNELIRAGSVERGYTGFMGIVALSAVIGQPIDVVYPLTSTDGLYSELNQKIIGRGVDGNVDGPSIMWTTVSDGEFTGDIRMNHFVGLLKNPKQGRPNCII